MGELSAMDMLSTVDKCEITISLSSEQHLCLTLESVWHMEAVVSVTLQTMSYRTSWGKKRGIVHSAFVQNPLLHNLKDSKGFSLFVA